MQKRKVPIIILLILSIVLVSGENYVINGDSVYSENNFVKTTVTPHTALSPVDTYEQIFEVENKKAQSGDLCVAYVFDKLLAEGKVWLEKNTTGLFWVSNISCQDYHCVNETFDGTCQNCTDDGHYINQSYLYWENVNSHFSKISYNGKEVYYTSSPPHFESYETHRWKIKYIPSPAETDKKWEMYSWNSLSSDCLYSFTHEDDRNFLLELDPWWEGEMIDLVQNDVARAWEFDNDLTDKTTNNNTLIATGTISFTTGLKKLGTHSVNLTLNSNYLMSSWGNTSGSESNITKPHAVSLWFYLQSWSDPGNVYSGQVTQNHDVWSGRSYVYEQFGNGNGLVYNYNNLTSTAGLGVWQHVVLSYNGTHMTGYRDGQVGNTVPGFPLGNAINAEVGFGSENPTAPEDRNMNGYFDTIMIFNRSLNASEVSYLYNNGNGRTYADLANIAPTHSVPLLNSTYGTNFTNENLTCYNQSTYDADENLVTNIFVWYKDSNPLNSLYLPFETNFTDYSGSGNIITNNGAVIGEGKIGNGSEFNGTVYVKVDDSSFIDFSNGKSWEIWFKRNSTGTETLFDKSDNSTNYKLYFDSNNKLVFLFSIPEEIAGYYAWITSSEAEFNEGTKTNTVWDTNHLELSSDQSFGAYTSKIFDSTALSSWNNISWTKGGPYEEELPNNKQTETKWISGNADMAGNVLLLHTNLNWEDSSGENNDGTANGDVTFSTLSKFGSHAGSFDGNGDYVSTSTTNFPTGNENITIEAWFKIDDLNSDNNMVTYGNNAGHQAIQLFHRASDDKLVLHYWGGYGAVTAPLNDNNWHYAAAIHANNNNYLYLDGVLAGTTSYASANIVNNFNHIGKVTGYSSYDFDGLMDEVAVYDRSLSSTEILEHYQRGALKLNLSVRSCDDGNCSGESYIDVTNYSPQNLSVSNNRYFQYKFNFETWNVSYTSELYNVTVGYALYNGEAIETNLTSASSVADANWHQAAVTFDDTGSDNFKLYFDGSLDNSKTETNLPQYKDNDLYIGKDFAGTGYFTGNLDEFRIYGHALSAEQVSNNFNLNYNKIISSETTRGESYVCSITPTDGINDGITKNSSSLIIRNYVPAAPTLLSPANGYSSGLLPEFNWTASGDYDGDNVYYLIQIDNNSDFSSTDYSNILSTNKDASVTLDSSKIDTYFWRVLATDNIGNSSWSSVRNFTYARWEITFNVTSGEFDIGELDNVNISNCNYSGFSQGGDTTNPYGPYGFPPGNWQCNFERTLYFPKTKIFTVDANKIVNVTMSLAGKLTYEEHTWLEALYNCIILKDCDLYNLLLQINETVSNTWQHVKPTDTSVITSETAISNILNSTSNITYEYTVSIPIKAGYGLGDYLPVRIGFWFMNQSNTSCYNQGTLPEGVTVIKPYCNPLMVQTLGPMGGSVSFRVDLRPNLAAGTYNVKRIIEIDPNEQWEGYGQEVIDIIQVTEEVTKEGSVNLDKTGEELPVTSSSSSSSGSSGGGGSSVTNIVNIYNVTNIIREIIKEDKEEKINGKTEEKTLGETIATTEETKANENKPKGALTGAAIALFDEVSSKVTPNSILVGMLIMVCLTLAGMTIHYRAKSKK